MKKKIYLGLLGTWLMSPPKQQSAQTSSPEVSPKLSSVKEASSQSSSEQGESSDDSDSEITSLPEAKAKILELKRERVLFANIIFKLENNQSLLDIIQMQDKEIEKLKKEVKASRDEYFAYLDEARRKREKEMEKLEKQCEIAGRRADEAIASMIRQGRR